MHTLLHIRVHTSPCTHARTHACSQPLRLLGEGRTQDWDLNIHGGVSHTAWEPSLQAWALAGDICPCHPTQGPDAHSSLDPKAPWPGALPPRVHGSIPRPPNLAGLLWEGRHGSAQRGGDRDPFLGSSGAADSPPHPPPPGLRMRSSEERRGQRSCPPCFLGERLARCPNQGEGGGGHKWLGRPAGTLGWPSAQAKVHMLS